MSDTVTLELQGRVSLEQFADAIARFQRLVSALSQESKAQVHWEIEALEAGSATVTSRGIPENGTVPGRIEQVVRNYLEVGQALEAHTTLPYPPRVTKEASGLAALLRSGVEAVRFETAEAEATVREIATNVYAPAPELREHESYGAVSGRVQTLTSRSRLRFTLYDRLYDRAVSCYLAEGRESLMREMWDKLVTVEGVVTRDTRSGRPLAVRNIARVTRIEEAAPQDYIKARRVLPLGADDPSPEDAIRRLRNGG